MAAVTEGSAVASGGSLPGGVQRSDVEKLADLVYRLLRDDLQLQRERRGAALARWR